MVVQLHLPCFFSSRSSLPLPLCHTHTPCWRGSSCIRYTEVNTIKNTFCPRYHSRRVLYIQKKIAKLVLRTVPVEGLSLRFPKPIIRFALKPNRIQKTTSVFYQKPSPIPTHNSHTSYLPVPLRKTKNCHLSPSRT